MSHITPLVIAITLTLAALALVFMANAMRHEVHMVPAPGGAYLVHDTWTRDVTLCRLNASQGLKTCTTLRDAP